ncbi:MAG: hypothetical protein AAFN77_19135 [Planctomycetota bacterium]
MSPAIVNSILVVGATLVALVAVFHPRVVKSVSWRATVTPLASIIGSGFLILGPILKHEFGSWGIAVMLLLCVVAYLFGDAIRYNIARYAQEDYSPTPLIQRMESVASGALAIAYVVSITYYLNLFGAFAVTLTSVNDQTHARIVTTAALCFIAVFGWLRGFSALERIEEGTVGLKLAIIAGLLLGLVALFFERMSQGVLSFSTGTGATWHSAAVALGLVITVQGFETSRYLGNEFDAKTRIATMKLSQWVSSAIYLVYIALTVFCFLDAEVPDSETGIIGMTNLIAPVLPAMLVAAALAAQFSAAVADTGGCGGLTEEVTNHRLKAKAAYLLIGTVGICLTWVADIYSIIAYASRAFAVYYALQCGVAATFAFRSSPTRSSWRGVFYGLLAVLALAIFAFGRSAE